MRRRRTVPHEKGLDGQWGKEEDVPALRKSILMVCAQSVHESFV